MPGHRKLANKPGHFIALNLFFTLYFTRIFEHLLDNSVHVRPVTGNSPFLYNYHDDVDLSRIVGEAGNTINM